LFDQATKGNPVTILAMVNGQIKMKGTEINRKTILG
jgi:hypothetical protein